MLKWPHHIFYDQVEQCLAWCRINCEHEFKCKPGTRDVDQQECLFWFETESDAVAFCLLMT